MGTTQPHADLGAAAVNDPQNQELVLYRGETRPFLFGPVSSTDITGSTFAFALSTRPGNDLVSGYPIAGTIVDAAAGTFSVTVSAANLTANTTYAWDVYQTDASGYRARIAGGTLRYRESVRRP